MNSRDFFTRLASGLFVSAAPGPFLPKLIKPAWKALPPVFRPKIGHWLTHAGGLAPAEILLDGKLFAVLEVGHRVYIESSAEAVCSLRTSADYPVQIQSYEV